jgi:hypothetical protein
VSTLEYFLGLADQYPDVAMITAFGLVEDILRRFGWRPANGYYEAITQLVSRGAVEPKEVATVRSLEMFAHAIREGVFTPTRADAQHYVEVA